MAGQTEDPGGGGVEPEGLPSLGHVFIILMDFLTELPKAAQRTIIWVPLHNLSCPRSSWIRHMFPQILQY